MNGRLNSLYTIPGTHRKDFIKGSRLTMIVGYSMMGFFCIIIVLYKCKIVIKNKGKSWFRLLNLSCLILRIPVNKLSISKFYF